MASGQVVAGKHLRSNVQEIVLPAFCRHFAGILPAFCRHFASQVIGECRSGPIGGPSADVERSFSRPGHAPPAGQHRPSQPGPRE